MEFAEFRESFSYGSRTDLAFKFLKRLSDEAAAEFFRALLEAVGDAVDDGDVQPIIDLAYEWQVRAYSRSPDEKPSVAYREAPFAAPAKPMAESRIVLLTSSGHFVAGSDPEPFGVAGMTQEEAISRISEFTSSSPQLSEIPRDTASSDLRVRHGGYDVRGAVLDPNVAFPLTPLLQLAGAGVVGEVAPTAFSFVGACSQAGLRREALPAWIERLRNEEADAVLLVPV